MATLFLSALLLFSIQPMIAKWILPKFGGAAAVWNTCVLFFQASLLAGYGYAHFLTRRFDLKRQAAIHLAVLVIALLLLTVRFLSFSSVFGLLSDFGLRVSDFTVARQSLRLPPPTLATTN